MSEPANAASSSAAVLTNPPAQAAPPAEAGGAPTAAASGQASAGVPWLPGADEATVGYIQNKGWQDPSQLLAAYRGAEKFISAPISQRLVVPGPDAPKAEMDAFYDRLGRPSTPDGYGFDKMEGANPEFAKMAQAKMHELGIPLKAGEELAKWWNGYAGETKQQMESQKAQAFQADELALKDAWGAAYTQELAKAQTAVRAFGISAEQIDALQGAMGHKATMEFFAKIGGKVGEHEFVGSGKTGFSDAMTPAMAKDRIKTLSTDANFQARYRAKDAEALAEMQRLHQWAYPE